MTALSAAPTPITLLLVDDDPRFRQGIITLLHGQTPAVEVTGEAATVADAIALITRHPPQLILLDLELQTGDGVEALLWLREQELESRILVLSAHQEEQRVFRAMQAGAWGYIFKTTVSDCLSTAIQTVLAGQIYLPPAVATCFFRRFQDLAAPSLPSVATLHLTEREQEVLYWLVQGESNVAIAKHLHVTVATVKAHLTSIFDKLDVRSRTQAIVKAVRLGLVQP